VFFGFGDAWLLAELARLTRLTGLTGLAELTGMARLAGLPGKAFLIFLIKRSMKSGRKYTRISTEDFSLCSFLN
jgi:hypothetical protein